MADAAATVEALYRGFLSAWDRQQAGAMADAFADDGVMIGFDGSDVAGRKNIHAHLAQIFKDHPTPVYVAKVREVRLAAPDLALLRAHTGLAPRNGGAPLPELTAVQSAVYQRRGEKWLLALFQNTPAGWHGREPERTALVEELRVEMAARP